MTGSHASHAQLSPDSLNADSAMALPPLVGPYAKPIGDGPQITAIDAVLIDAIRASAGPYVPAPLRSRPSTAQPIVSSQPTVSAAVDTAELPWIDAFVDEQPSSESQSETSVSDVEQWPLGEASSTIRSLVNGLGPPVAEPVGQTVDFEALESALLAPLPMWRDDDLMDIMPVRPLAESHSGSEHWAEKARREATTENHAEAAATLLEAVASRVRDGSLIIPGYAPSMSDAAGLAAALAALLSTHE